MATYGSEIDPAVPQGDKDAADLDIFIQNHKAAIIERLELEHYSVEKGAAGTSTTTGNPSAQGRHIAGKVGCIGKGSHADMNALVTVDTPPGDGSFWITTDPSGAPDNYDSGTTYRYTSTEGWKPAQLATGTIYASKAEVDAGTVEDKAVNPKTLTGFIKQYAVWEHQEPNGTDGGSTVGGLNTRKLNTEVSNTIVGASLDTGTYIMTLPAGTYRIEASAVIRGTGEGRLRLWDITNSAIVAASLNRSSGSSGSAIDIRESTDHLQGYFTLAGTTNLRLEHNLNGANGGDGMGITSSLADVERYARVLISKEA